MARMALLHGVNANLLCPVDDHVRQAARVFGGGGSQAKTPAATLLPVTTEMSDVPRALSFSKSCIEID